MKNVSKIRINHKEVKPEYIKIPKQLFSIEPSHTRLYAAYVDLKAFNTQGVIRRPFKVSRHYYNYWCKKLISCGWATKKNDDTYLKSYQEIWRLMGVERSWHKRIKKYKYTYHKIGVSDIPEKRDMYTKFLIEPILTKIAGNKLRQIKWRLNNKQLLGMAKQTETFLSGRKVARLLGLKSSASGNKYRSKYFSVINEPTVRNKYRNTHLFQCKKVAL